MRIILAICILALAACSSPNTPQERLYAYVVQNNAQYRDLGATDIAVLPSLNAIVLWKLPTIFLYKSADPILCFWVELTPFWEFGNDWERESDLPQISFELNDEVITNVHWSYTLSLPITDSGGHLVAQRGTSQYCFEKSLQIGKNRTVMQVLTTSKRSFRYTISFDHTW